ncbi:MAG: hypothetical protein AAGD38_06725 [Acidobacteriota bacterium]
MAGSDQQIVQQLLDKFYPKLNDPSSSVYLPKIIGEKYDPDNVGDLPVGALPSDPGEKAAKQICAAVAPFGEAYIPTPGVSPTIDLQNVTIAGLSNVKTDRPIAGGPDGRTITAEVQFLTLPAPLPQAVTGTGNFILDQQCCTTTDGTTCKSGVSKHDEEGKGTFKFTIKSGAATLVIKIADLAPGVLTLKVSSVEFKPVLPFEITVDITTAPEKARQGFNNLAEGTLNTNEAQSAIIMQLNKSLNDDNRLSGLGQILTDKADQYLRDNHLYPFNGGAESLF